MNDRFCSLNSRSFVDTLSSIANIDGLDSWTAWDGLLDGGLPVDLLPLLYHELTHHWVLDSPLGSALSLSKISALWALRGGKSGPSGVSPGDYVKYLAIGTFLRAWSEGLAQYAEFDVTHGSARSVSYPSSTLWWLYGRDGRSDSELGNLANVRLREARSTNEMVQRKANALRQPFTVKNGGYLPGYLAVKRIASRLVKAGGPFNDADFILTYLKAYICDDPWVVKNCVTLDGNLFFHEYFNHLRARFALLNSLSDEQLRHAGEELDSYYETRPELDSGDLDQLVNTRAVPGIFASRSEQEVAQKMLIRRLEEFGVWNAVRSADRASQEHVFETFYRAVRFQRHLFCLSSLEIAASELLGARLTSGEHVIMVKTPKQIVYLLSHWNDQRYTELRSLKKIEIDRATRNRIEDTGILLEVWIDPARMKAFVCLHSGHAKRYGIRSLIGPCEVAELPEIMPRADALDMLKRLDELLAESRVRGSDGGIVTVGDGTRHLKEEIVKEVEHILSQLAFPWDEADGLPSLFVAKGLGGLPSYRPDGLRGLAVRAMAAVNAQTAEQLCEIVGLRLSCLEQADALIGDMKKLGWDVLSGAWTV